MISCNFPARIKTFKASTLVLACRIVLITGALIAVNAGWTRPVCANEPPKYVGDFPPPRQQSIQIIDDGPVVHDYRHAPIIVVPERPEGARPPLGMPIPAGVKSSKSEVPTAVKVNSTADFEPPIFKFPPDLLPRSEARSQSKVAPQHRGVQDPPRLKVERFRFPAGSTNCDFPLPRLNFPREKRWPVAPQSIPRTVGPNVRPLPAKPSALNGAGRKVGPPLLRSSIGPKSNASQINTYDSGYVPDNLKRAR